MRKALNRKAIEKEAALWKGMKKAIEENPGKICHK